MDKFRIKKTTKHKDTNYCSDSSSKYVCESNSFAEKKNTNIRRCDEEYSRFGFICFD